jgi:hypothetical protein
VIRLAKLLAVLLWGLSVIVALTGGLALPILAVPGFGTVGLVLILNRPTNSIGWLMIAMGAVPAAASALGLESPEFQNGAVLAALVLVLVVFPNGRPPSRKWWIPVALLGAGWLVAVIFPAFDWNRSDGFTVPIGVVAALAGVVWCGSAPFVRFRSVSGVEREQLRWLGATATLTAVTAIIPMIDFALAGPRLLGEITALAATVGGTLGIPAAILIAITRYRLYEIDRIISRTVTYTLVGAAVAVVYSTPVLLLPRLLGESNDLVIATSTLAAAAAFNPARRRIQHGVDRRFNRARFDAEHAIERLAHSLGNRATFEAIEQEISAVLGATLAPRHSSISRRRPVG